LHDVVLVVTTILDNEHKELRASPRNPYDDTFANQIREERREKREERREKREERREKREEKRNLPKKKKNSSLAITRIVNYKNLYSYNPSLLEGSKERGREKT
jgi:hypothetical protein